MDDAREPDGGLRSSGRAFTRRRRWLRWSGAAVVALICVLLHQATRPEPPVIEAITPDGKYHVEFVAGGVGRIDHRPDSRLYIWFHQFMRSWAPVVLSRKLPKPRNASVRGEPGANGAPPLMALFRFRPVAGSNAGSPLQPLRDVDFLFDESTGYSFQQTWARASLSDGMAISFDRFPRRDSVIEVRMVQKGTRRHLMSFSIPNDMPATGTFDAAPTALPTTLASSTIQCTLTDLAKTHEADRLHPVIEVKPLDRAWESHLLETALEDATGNRGDRLSPFEPSWKVRTRIFRTVDAEFAASETWHSPPIPLPARETASTLHVEGRLENTAMHLLCLKGPGLGQVGLGADDIWVFSENRVSPTVSQPVPGVPGAIQYFGVDMPYSERPFLLLDVRHLKVEDHLLVIIRDQDQQILGKADNPPTRYATNRCRSAIEFTPLNTTKEVTATVIISKPQTFEFYVEPPKELKAQDRKTPAR